MSSSLKFDSFADLLGTRHCTCAHISWFTVRRRGGNITVHLDLFVDFITSFTSLNSMI